MKVTNQPGIFSGGDHFLLIVHKKYEEKILFIFCFILNSRFLISFLSDSAINGLEVIY